MDQFYFANQLSITSKMGRAYFSSNLKIFHVDLYVCDKKTAPLHVVPSIASIVHGMLFINLRGSHVECPNKRIKMFRMNKRCFHQKWFSSKQQGKVEIEGNALKYSNP